MTVTYLGSRTIGDTVPGVNGAILSAMGDVQARETALASFVPSITPPSISADIQTNGEILVNLQAAATFGIEPPSVDAQVAIMADALLLLQGQLQVILDLLDVFGTAGVHAYAYDGQADAMGGELTAELAGGFPGGAPTDHANAIILATTIPATWVAMAAVFRVLP
jgi:hypothetical protein